MKVYNKLVRDRIPEIIAAEGRTFSVRTLTLDEYKAALVEKLGEEYAEFTASRSIQELADILEVVYALSQHLGTSHEELEAIRIQKARNRGAFSDRLLLQHVDG